MRTETHPLRPALLIGAVAELLFLFRLTIPHKLVFDEVHYVPAARVLLSLAAPANTEHPLFGKELIALGMALFGDNSFGWRIMSTIAGTAAVLGVYAIAWLLCRQTRLAVVAALVTLLNATVFIQARIAMLDGFMAALVITGLACLLWAMRAPTAASVWRRWLAGAILLGLATATKWLAAPYIAAAGLGFLLVRAVDRIRNGRPLLAGHGQRHWPGLPAAPALLALGLVSVLVYFLTFAPAFYYSTDPLTLRTLLPFQSHMYAQQTQVLPPHTYQSRWWSWPLLIRPIWYFYEQADGAQRGILLLGNPAVMWGGLLAVVACLWAGARSRDPRALTVASLWIFSLAIWAAIPKSLGFYYYYYLSSIWLALPIAAALDRFAVGSRRVWGDAYLALVLGLFLYFFPIIAALPLAGARSFEHWMWFPSWP